LPALPAVTPFAAASPSDASLLIAPRILKLPVRCRFSAFSTMSPPVISDRAFDVVTGVRFTTPAPAAPARPMSSEEIDGASMPPPTVQPMRALLVANAADADPGFVGARFRHHGYAFTECHREHPTSGRSSTGTIWCSSSAASGASTGRRWPTASAAESALIQAAHERGVPQFGICFGNQSMAHALGGTVAPAPTAEVGWYDVRTDAPDVIAPGPWLQWHADVVTLPTGAEEMARSDVGPQAWRLGRSFCTQFHPEATESMIARWCAGGGADELKRMGTSAEQMMETTRRNVRISRRQSDRLVDWFVEHVAHIGSRPPNWAGSFATPDDDRAQNGG
jgi:GMP synthase-like glutamine amidotransferase